MRIKILQRIFVATFSAILLVGNVMAQQSQQSQQPQHQQPSCPAVSTEKGTATANTDRVRELEEKLDAARAKINLLAEVIIKLIDRTEWLNDRVRVLEREMEQRQKESNQWNELK